VSDEQRPTHFDYEALDRWERRLRRLGFQNISITRKGQGHNVSRVQLEMTLVPWEPLPDISKP
jgi:hypothetical protein